MAIQNRQTTPSFDMNSPARESTSNRRGLILLGLALILVLSLLFARSYVPEQMLFSNDGPLGINMSASARLPEAFTGWWADLNWLGIEFPVASPDLTYGLRLLIKPVLFGKFYVPLSLLVLGLCAGIYFRQARLVPLACVLGGLATALNSEYFTTACWGAGMFPLTFGMNFLALAALCDTTSRRQWVKVVLAGMAVGMGIMEGFDIGAIFSLYIAAFALFQALIQSGPLPNKLIRGGVRIVLVAICAAFIAAQTIGGLIGTQIKGVAGTAQDEQTKQQHWDWATQWSQPKVEMLQLLSPGLFGYRMEAPGGGKYWGTIGQQPGWEKHHQGIVRFGAGTIYASILVLMGALWAVLQSFRKGDSVFTDTQKLFIRFWAGAAFVSVLLAFGRFAPFYQFFYALPYASTIRIPAKFLHPFQLSLLILFAHGIHGLSRRYLGGQSTPVKGLKAHLRNWWAIAPAFDKKWTTGSLAAIGASLLAWLVYSSARADLQAYLVRVAIDPSEAPAIASFSVKEAGWFVLFLSLTVAVMTLLLSRFFVGPRAKWGGLLLGLLLVVDLSRANTPWIIYYDYKERYASNRVLDLLRDKPYEHRVAILPFPFPDQLSTLKNLYGMEWSQHQFLYYDIQSLDIIQMSRQPENLIAYEGALQFRGDTNMLHLPARRWQLTNTRYLLGPTLFLNALNEQLDPGQRRFRVLAPFDIVPKPGVTAVTQLDWQFQLTAVLNTNGQFAIFEFTGALPRVKLYSNWLVSTNDEATLKQLADPAFDPTQVVLVSDPIRSPQSPPATNQNPGTVEFVSYAPKLVKLRVNVKTPAVLLHNDHLAPNWQVWVDGQKKPILRCNYLMRGVLLETGEHSVEFRFEPHLKGLYVSLAALALGVVLLGFLIVLRPKPEVEPVPAVGNPAIKPPPRKTTTR